jgi:phage terminase large subunit
MKKTMSSNAINIETHTTRVFDENWESFDPILINRGGARSSKSYSIGQKICTRFLKGNKRKQLIVMKTGPSMRVSTLPLITSFFEEWKVLREIRYNRTSMDFYYKNNWMHLTSIDDREKIKSSEWNDIWVEEATRITYEDFLQLQLRNSAKVCDEFPNQITLSFNPVDSFHWIKTKVIDTGDTDVKEIVSTYKDNPYLSKAYLKILRKLKDQDKNYWRVYAKGLWGKLENLIYANSFKVVNLKNFPEKFDETIYGLDFGFNNETALIEVNLKDNVPYERERIYQREMTNEMLIRRMDKLGISKKDPIYADSAEPKKIEEISQHGYNIIGAHKSVLDGIDFVKRFTTYISHESDHLIEEKQQYSWKVDKKSNLILDEPVKYKDHGCDAERYALFSHLRRRKYFLALAGVED